MKFNSLEELYKKLLPALRTKVNELKRNNIFNIKNEDIWSYLKECSWAKRDNLSLGEMVDDILNVSSINLINYKNKGID